MADIVDRLETMLERHVLRSLPGAETHLAGEPLRKLLSEYLVWRDRFVSPIPRKVKVAPELLASAQYTTYTTELAVVQAKIEAGEEITAHLSDRLSSPFGNTVAPGIEYRTNRDALLSIWGLHHLHLTKRARARTVRRGDDVLIAAFRDDTAYLIAIVPHPTLTQGWATQSIFEVLACNWPGSGLVQESKTAIGLSQVLSDADRRALHNAGVSTMMEVNGKVYAPGRVGQMADGTPMVVAQRLMGLFEMLRRCRTDLEGTLASAAGSPVPRLYWTPEIRCPHPGYEEYCGFGATGPHGPLFVPIQRIV